MGSVMNISDFMANNKPAAGDLVKKEMIVEPSTQEEIWEAFKNLTEEDLDRFNAMHGYDVSAIEEIGVDKFIAAMDWKSVAQVGSWKTDMFHNVICPECRQDFGVLELESGLCINCRDAFHFEYIQDFDSVYRPQTADGEEGPISSVAYFILSSDFRNLFKKDTGDIKLDSQTNEILKLTILSRALNDYVAMETAKNSGVGVTHVAKGKLLNFVREYRIPGRLAIGKDLPHVYDALKEFSAPTYNAETNEFYLVAMLLNLSLKMSELAHEVMFNN